MSVPDPSRPYALFHDFDAPTDRDAPIVAALADRIAQPCEILDLGCGSGRLSRAALATGHRVIGIDLSEPMLELARAATPAGAAADWRLGDMRNFGPPSEAWRFDLAVCSHNTFYLLTGAAEPAALLARLRGMARGPQSRIWLDLFNPEPFLDALPPARALVHVYTRTHPALERPVAKWMSFFPDRGRRLLVGYSTYEVFEADGHNRRWQIREDLRWIPPAELDVIAERAGWRVTDRRGDYDGSPFSEDDSSRLLLTLAPA
jgi:SAM-dependent methyltransferase